jgi:tetratricopeptide (TPR) repeat protein
MTPDLPADLDRWRQIEAILDQALEVPQEGRGSLLDEVCAGDPGLRADVEALLAMDAAAGGFLELPAGEYAPVLLAEAAGAEEPEDDLSGRQLGPYRLLREIGSGGMGTVYEAEDARLGRRVAVKVLPAGYSRDPKAKERFLREARAASTVDHPNLCTVHDVGESDDRIYIVLSLYEGETLRERLRRGPLPPAEARDVALQVARGLARAHEAGITHRDLKPANVMLTRRGEVKILDFGIARLEGDEASLTRTGALWGTPAYMSPEQARGEPVDRRTDVWSLGVLLYEMTAGRRPFGGETVPAVLSAILVAEPEPLDRVCPGVPPDLARVVARALAKDPAERYASAAELLTDLEAGPQPAHRLRPKALRKLRVAVAPAAVVLVAAVLFSRLWHPAAKPPLRVAVLRPIVMGDDPESAFLASEVVEASLAALISLEGVQPLDPPEKDERRDSEAESLRSHEADEVLRPRLDCREDECWVTLRRLRKPGGAVLATVGPFEVQTGVENAYGLADAVRVHLEGIYPEYQPRIGAKVRPEDYSAYIELERRVDLGERLGKNDLARLDALLRTSPGLLGADLLAAGLARNQGAYDLAFAYAKRARELAPYDPRPLFARLRIETATGLFNDARKTIDQLKALVPEADIRVQSAKAELLEARGKLKEAHPLRQEVARRRPTWRHIRELAALEASMGASKDARRRFESLLAEHPDNQYLLEDLAALEVNFGDLNRAAALYEKLLGIRPQLSYLTNLGFVRLVLGDYAAAASACRQALLLEANDFLTRFNLATALDAQGDLDGGHRLYRALTQEIAALPALPDAQTRMLHALCLAHLGRRGDAVRIVDEVLEQRVEDAMVLYQVAQLYALLRDSVSARYYVKLARERGLRRELFTLPVFNSLAEDPDFRDLLDTPQAP